VSIEYPITVNTITPSEESAWRPNMLFGGKCGDFVSVRPVDEKYDKKTYLGVLLGEIATAATAGFVKQTGELRVLYGLHNPAIYVPELSTVIFGYESWWGVIESEKQLREITDDDIQNAWYVRALKQLTERGTGPTSGDRQP
jgi:hypothetical protein